MLDGVLCFPSTRRGVADRDALCDSLIEVGRVVADAEVYDASAPPCYPMPRWWADWPARRRHRRAARRGGLRRTAVHRRDGSRRREVAPDSCGRRRDRPHRLRCDLARRAGGQHVQSRTVDRRVRTGHRGRAGARIPYPGPGVAARRVGDVGVRRRDRTIEDTARQPDRLRRLRAHRPVRLGPVPRLRVYRRCRHRIGPRRCPRYGLARVGDTTQLDALLRESDVVVVAYSTTSDAKRSSTSVRSSRRCGGATFMPPQPATSGTNTRQAPASAPPQERCPSDNCATC
jgi:hypothetical protein